MDYRRLPDRLALALGKACHDPELAHLAEAFVAQRLPSGDWERLADYASFQKVIPQTYANARRLLETPAAELGQYLIEKLESEYRERLYQRRVLYPQAVELIRSLLVERRIEHLFFKGTQLATLYDPEVPRQSNDIDLMLPDIAAFCAAAGALGEAGFDIYYEETPWLARHIDRGRRGAEAAILTGHVTLRRLIENLSLKVDLHVRNMSVNELGELLCGWLWERAQGEFPSREDALLILVAHAVNHSYLIQKDYNDLYALLKNHAADLDWAYIAENVRRSGLGPMLGFMLDIVRQHYTAEIVPEEAGPLLKASGVGKALTTRGIRRGWRPGMPWSALLIQGTATFLGYREQGWRVARSEAWQIARYLTALYLAEQHYQRPPISRWLERFEREVSLIDLRRGQRVNLVDAQEVIADEDDGASASGGEPLAPDGYRAVEIGPGAIAFEKDGAELLHLARQFLAPTNVGLFTETDAQKIRYLIERVRLSQQRERH